MANIDPIPEKEQTEKQSQRKSTKQRQHQEKKKRNTNQQAFLDHSTGYLAVLTSHTACCQSSRLLLPFVVRCSRAAARHKQKERKRIGMESTQRASTDEERILREHLQSKGQSKPAAIHAFSQLSIMANIDLIAEKNRKKNKAKEKKDNHQRRRREEHKSARQHTRQAEVRRIRT
jgi:hypothetical protein